jgi:hypothetical protein
LPASSRQGCKLDFEFGLTDDYFFRQDLGCVIAQRRQFLDAERLDIEFRHGIVSNWDNLAVGYRISSQADDKIIHRRPE